MAELAGKHVRSIGSYRAAFCLTLASLVAACGSSAPSSTSGETSSSALTLRDGLTQEIVGFYGLTISADEAECLDSHFSEALGIPYPATWSAYRAAMDARVATVASAYEATGDISRDPLPGESMQACLTEDTQNTLFALSLVAPAKWSDLTDTQRTCLLDQAAPYKRTIPASGISHDALKTACEIA